MESIYNLVDKHGLNPEPKKAKKPLYRSKYPGNMPPTGSTFGASLTGVTGVTNCGGNMSLHQARKHRQDGTSWGPTVRKPLQTATMRSKLPEKQKFVRHKKTAPKPAVPKRGEAPQLLTRTKKNYVQLNAVENILRKPDKSKCPREKTAIDTHAEYGKVPAYLAANKQAIAEEQAYLATLNQPAADTGSVKVMSAEERDELVEEMKATWDKLYFEYQKFSHQTVLDTISKVRKKEQLESAMKQLEKNIEMMDNKRVLITE